jgi:nitrate/TMAO reductase-like tetraheme cytochrome c subunit
MRILSLLIFCFMLFFLKRQSDSPHGADFKISCKTCHSSKGWQLDKEIYSFDHNTTKLPLVGQHSNINCRQCHPTLIFGNAKTNCIDCHNDVHQATVGPDCSRCHTPSSWLVKNINEIHDASRFPLLGAHRTADCYQCHKSESLARFDVPGINCIDCHRANYMATTNPNHIQAGFSENCSPCHHINSFQWDGAGFNHNIFPLVQGHSAIKCADCHKTGSYSGTSPICYSCHQQDFLATRNPDHNLSKFSTNCQDCHSLNPGWKPSTFNHNTFPLTLGHTTPACIDCHINGNYTTTPTDCYSCHLTDYNNSANPNHKTLGFSTTCSQCHTTTPGWKPAAYTQHDSQFFPIYSGRHRGQWTVCTDCHTNPANYSLFTCITCHNKPNMDSAHSGIGGYSYVSTACYQCHPRGSTN